MTVSQWFEIWIGEILPLADISDVTRRGYIQIASIYVLPHVGDVGLEDLAPARAARCRARRPCEPRRSRSRGRSSEAIATRCTWTSQRRAGRAEPFTYPHLPSACSASIEKTRTSDALPSVQNGASAGPTILCSRRRLAHLLGRTVAIDS